MARCLGTGQLHIRLSTAFVQCRKPDAAVIVHRSGLSLLHLFSVSEVRTCVFVCNKEHEPTQAQKSPHDLSARPFRLLLRYHHRLQGPSVVTDYSNLSLAFLHFIIKSVCGGIQLVTRAPRRARSTDTEFSFHGLMHRF